MPTFPWCVHLEKEPGPSAMRTLISIWGLTLCICNYPLKRSLPDTAALVDVASAYEFGSGINISAHNTSSTQWLPSNPLCILFGKLGHLVHCPLTLLFVFVTPCPLSSLSLPQFITDFISWLRDISCSQLLSPFCFTPTPTIHPESYSQNTLTSSTPTTLISTCSLASANFLLW